MWNRLDYRPLEGFVFAITHLISPQVCRLCAAPAMIGNTIVWKPSETALWQK